MMPSNQPLVSVCIPVYDGEKYIAETIQSVLAQTYTRIEILVQDNASRDDTWRMLQELATKNSQLCIERNEQNYGMAANWNLVINRARGDYIMLLSADDLLLPHFIEKCLSMFKRYTVDAVVSNHLFLKAGTVSPRKKLVASGVYQHHSKVILLYNPFSVNFTLFSKESIAGMKVQGNLFRSFMTCDYDLCLRISLSEMRIAYCEEPLGIYRLHDSNLSKQGKKMLRQAALVFFSHKRALQNNCRSAYRITLLRFISRAFFQLLRAGIYDARIIRILRSEIYRELTSCSKQKGKGMFKSIRDAVFNLIPKRFHLPAFYYYYKTSLKLEHELVILPKLIPGCRVAVDIGANRGLYTYFLSGFCKKVVSFEPQPGCFANIAAYAKPNITAHNVGLSSETGVLNLYIPHDSHGAALDGLASFRPTANAERLEVPVKRLDDYALAEVDFIKIDVEGYEYEVLEGAKKTILENKPVLLIEIEQRHLNRPIEDVFNKIIQLGYEGFYLQGQDMIGINNFTYGENQEPYIKNVFDKKYVNNFLFFPKQVVLQK